MSDPTGEKRLFNYRPLLTAAVGFCVGIFAFELALGVEVAWLKAALSVCALVVCAAAFVFGLVRRKPIIWLLALFIAFGLMRAAVAIPKAVPEGTKLVCGTVESVSEKKPGVVTLRSVTADGESLYCKVQASLPAECVPGIGERIEFSSELKSPSRRFEGYDERLVLLGDGIGYKASAESYETLDTGRLPVLRALADARRFLLTRIEEVFGEGSGVVSGFLLGAKQGVDEADTESFRATGTAHLLALSGFHVMLLTSMIFLLIPKRFPKLRFIIGAVFLLFYCGIAAFSPSIVRASIMCGCMLLSELTERRRDSLSSLSLAALIILMVSPYKLFSVGFLLSFAATLGIVFVTSAGFGSSGLLARAASSALATLGATAATLLITARHFGAIPLYGIVANVVIVPIFSLAIAFSFIVLIIGVPFPAVAGLLAWGPNAIIKGGLFILRKISELPYALIEVPRASALSILLSLILLFAVSGYVLRPPKTRLKLAGAVFLLFTASVIADIIRV